MLIFIITIAVMAILLHTIRHKVEQLEKDQENIYRDAARNHSIKKL